MSAVAKIISIVGRYGSKAVHWCKNNVGTILNWINAGQTIEWIVNKIRRIVGV